MDSRERFILDEQKYFDKNYKVFKDNLSISERSTGTGRYFILFRDVNKPINEIKELFSSTINYFTISNLEIQEFPYPNKSYLETLIYYEEIGVALVNLNLQQKNSLLNTIREPIIIIPEEKVYRLDIDANSTKTNPPNPNNETETYGIKMLNITNIENPGKDISVAILDTGIDLKHDDFINRIDLKKHTKSFVENEPTVQDYLGHGTHCAGIACGDIDKNGIRYGVASQSTLFIGKVLNEKGEGFDSDVLDGINWAVKNNCRIISLSLGRPQQDDNYNPIYERTIRNANLQNTFIFAAAGNDSSRQDENWWNLSLPANSPSAMAVGAINEKYEIFNKSNRAIGRLQKMNFVAAGVNVYSSWSTCAKPPLKYNKDTGTSMATPFVAGMFAIEYSKNRTNVPFDKIYKDISDKCENYTEKKWIEDDCGKGLPQG